MRQNENLSIGIDSPVQIFDRDHKLIIEQYGSDLPAPNPNVRVILAIPCHAELTNNNFWRLLRSLVDQSADQTTFETLFVINNTKATLEAAKSHKDTYNIHSQYEGDREGLAERYNQNQSNLFIIKELNRCREMIEEGHAPSPSAIDAILGEMKEIVSISEYEQTVFTLAIENRVNILGIDASSEDKAIDLKTRNHSIFGIVRNIGEHLAYKRLQQAGHLADGCIDNPDGDCFLPVNYIASLLEQFENSRVDAIVKPSQFEAVEIPKNLENQNSLLLIFAGVIAYASLTLRDMRFWRKKALQNMINDFDDKSYFVHGFQLAIRPDVFRSVGGYPINVLNDDFEFSRAVFAMAHDHIHFLTNSHVLVSNREREGSVNGSGVGNFNFKGSESTVITRLRTELDERNEQLVDDAIAIDRDLESSSLSARYKEIKDNYYHRETLRRFQSIRLVRGLISDVAKLFSSGMDNVSVLATLKTYLNPRYADFIELNPILLDAIRGVMYHIDNDPALRTKLLGKSEIEVDIPPPQLVWIYLEKILPEYFSLPVKPNLDPNNLNTTNLRDYMYILEAAYIAKAEEYNRTH